MARRSRDRRGGDGRLGVAAQVRADQAAAPRPRRSPNQPDTAIEKACAEASQRVRTAAADRDQALARVEQAEQAIRLAQQETARAQTAEQAAGAETTRVRADAHKMLIGFRADAACDRDELRADLRA